MPRPITVANPTPMAAKHRKPANSSAPPARASTGCVISQSQSLFYERIEKSSHPTAKHLTTLIDKVWKQVADITKRVSDHFTAYTLHDMTHLGNVLYVMEELIPEEVWEKTWNDRTDPLGPMQCALCMLAALVHDLGMAPPDSLIAKLEAVEALDGILPDHADTEMVAYYRHYASQEDDVRAIAALRAEGGREAKIQQLRKNIRTEYLRQTHASDAISGVHRVKSWLNMIADQAGCRFECDGTDFTDLLADVAISHGQPLGWLHQRLPEKKTASQSWSQSETISPLHAAWLLRLGDILDFDASRAPAILYKHFAPDNAASAQHWLQHLGAGKRVFHWDSDPATLEFVGGQSSPNPEVANGVKNYIGWIKAELATVNQSRAASGLLKDLRFPLRLPAPDMVTTSLKLTGEWSSNPIKFELSQRELTQILMGEELYGEPSLCLRELAQNSLDALHLRWLRSELRRNVRAKYPGMADKDCPELHDLEPVDEVKSKEDLKITIRWGKEDLVDDRWGTKQREPRHYIEIEDNGTGMTLETVQRYFTQIGRSYYKSGEYQRERALFKAFGLPASEISQFGIGILSCFMVADLVEVWTRPASAPPNSPTQDHDARRPHHLKLWGPDGLFWHKPEAVLNEQGTRIRLWLKAGWKAESAMATMGDSAFKRKDLDSWAPIEMNYASEKATLDPIHAIWSTIVWPRYSIMFEPTRVSGVSTKEFTLDPEAHLRNLFRLDRSVAEQARGALPRWTNPEISGLLNLEWKIWDWEHLDTGSRFRFAVPARGRTSNISVRMLTSLSELFIDGVNLDCLSSEWLPLTLCEGQLPTKERRKVLIRGVEVPDCELAESRLPLFPGVGACCWIDLSGLVAPRLTANRESLLPEHRQRQDWGDETARFVDAIREEVQNQFKNLKYSGAYKALRHASLGLCHPAPRKDPSPQCWSLQDELSHVENDGVEKLAVAILLQFWSVVQNLSQQRHAHSGAFVRFYPSPMLFFRNDFAQNKAHKLGFESTLETLLLQNIDLANAAKRNNVQAPQDSETQIRALSMTQDVPSEFDFTHDLSFYKSRDISKIIDYSLRHSSMNSPRVRASYIRWNQAHILPEAFVLIPNTGLRCLGVDQIENSSKSSTFLSPWNLQIGQDHQKSQYSLNDGWNAPRWLDSLAYDLVLPFTHVPLGGLRANYPQWGGVRAIRPILLLPFLLSFSQPDEWSAFERLLDDPKLEFETNRVSQIQVLLPDPEICGTRFMEWTRDGMESKVVTACWFTRENLILWAPGFHDGQSIRQHGKTLDDWLAVEER